MAWLHNAAPRLRHTFPPPVNGQLQRATCVGNKPHRNPGQATVSDPMQLLQPVTTLLSRGYKLTLKIKKGRKKKKIRGLRTGTLSSPNTNTGLKSCFDATDADPNIRRWREKIPDGVWADFLYGFILCCWGDVSLHHLKRISPSCPSSALCPWLRWTSSG